ncbi:hypothetical protein PIB30_069909, partial [Stylosanthes scabra]|nr:hypothetical protein [Stylosanthes scabra]
TASAHSPSGHHCSATTPSSSSHSQRIFTIAVTSPSSIRPRHRRQCVLAVASPSSAEFNHAKEEATQKAAEDGSSAPDEMDLWCDIAGVKKGRVYGFGIESTTIDKRSSCHDSSFHWLQRSEHEELVKKLEGESSCLKTRLEKAEHAIEENNKLVQEMMKMMKFQVANPQVGGDGGKAHEE